MPLCVSAAALQAPCICCWGLRAVTLTVHHWALAPAGCKPSKHELEDLPFLAKPFLSILKSVAQLWTEMATKCTTESQSCLKFSHNSQHIGPVIKRAHQSVCVRLCQVAIGHCTLRKSCRQHKCSFMLTERLNRRNGRKHSSAQRLIAVCHTQVNLNTTCC